MIDFTVSVTAAEERRLKEYNYPQKLDSPLSSDMVG